MADDLAESAQTRLEAMVAASTPPSLTSEEITDLLVFGARPDSAGHAPDDDDWAGAWDLYASAGEGWRWKAGKISSAFEFSEDQQSFKKDQMFDHCMAMASAYDMRAGTSIFGTTPTTAISGITSATMGHPKTTVVTLRDGRPIFIEKDTILDEDQAVPWIANS